MYPLELFFHRGRVFLGGATDNMKEINFSVDSNLKYSLTNQTFKRSKYLKAYKESVANLFGSSAPLNNKLYNIKLEFTDSFGEATEQCIFHHSQYWTTLKNGNKMMHMHCSIGRELVGFLSHGLDKVKVHQPKILKNLINKKYAEAMMVNNGLLAVNEERANRDY